jgi:hypothetical protein
MNKIQLNIALVSLLIFFSLKSTFAVESYWVVMVKGQVYQAGVNNVLKIGDKISTDAKIKFSTKESYIVVMGAKGKFTIKPEPSKSNPNEFLAFVNSALLPVKSTGRLSTRGDEEGVADMAMYFGEENFVFIGDKHFVKVHPQKFELNESKFLIYRYEVGGKATSKKIAFEGNNLIFDKEALYANSEGKAIPPDAVNKVEIYKYDATTKSSTKIASFKPVYVSDVELKEQLSYAYKLYKEEMQLDAEKTEDELIRFVLDLYGKTDETILKHWLKANIIQ